MKEIYVNDLLHSMPGTPVVLPCWLAAKQRHGGILFLTLHDSSGNIQAVAEKENIDPKAFDELKRVPLESGVVVYGTLITAPNDGVEIQLQKLEVVGSATQQFCPQPRSDIDIFSPSLTNHLLTNRHVYLRNQKVIAIMQFRDALTHHMRQWFHENRFCAFDAPILTPVPLYDDGSALNIDVHGEHVFLTQCVGYYLEAGVHALERVYNMGPSFRGEESRSKRHLMEYWHIKAEAAWGNIEDVIAMIEEIFDYLTKACREEGEKAAAILGTSYCQDGLLGPFSRISYREAVAVLNEMGHPFSFGTSLSSQEEEILSKRFTGPFWITGIPHSIEPFPYCIHPDDPEVTQVADLIASNGFGELLGVAEKIYRLDELDRRMMDKNKLGNPRYEFIREIHASGCVPHIAFGMGLERLIRWMLNIPHVRDAVAFPRIFKRSIAP